MRLFRDAILNKFLVWKFRALFLNIYPCLLKRVQKTVKNKIFRIAHCIRLMRVITWSKVAKNFYKTVEDFYCLDSKNYIFIA